MKAVLVTGGIGSGKSLVCRMLRDRGVPVYDFDLRTKALYDEDPELLTRVVAAMAPHIASAGGPGSGGTDGHADASGLLFKDGRLDRQTLASVIFNDPHALSDLEAVVHPAVLRDFEAWRVAMDGMLQADGRPVGLVAAESAIALERPLFRGLFDKVILVDAPMALRMRRAAARDGVGEETVARRMRSQSLMNGISEGAAVTVDVDYIIENDRDEAALAAGLDNILSEILKL